MDDETLAIQILILADRRYRLEGAAIVASRPGPKTRCTDMETLTLFLLWLLIMPGC